MVSFLSPPLHEVMGWVHSTSSWSDGMSPQYIFSIRHFLGRTNAHRCFRQSADNEIQVPKHPIDSNTNESTLKCTWYGLLHIYYSKEYIWLSVFFSTSITEPTLIGYKLQPLVKHNVLPEVHPLVWLFVPPLAFHDANKMYCYPTNYRLLM